MFYDVEARAGAHREPFHTTILPSRGTSENSCTAARFTMKAIHRFHTPKLGAPATGSEPRLRAPPASIYSSPPHPNALLHISPFQHHFDSRNSDLSYSNSLNLQQAHSHPHSRRFSDSEQVPPTTSLSKHLKLLRATFPLLIISHHLWHRSRETHSSHSTTPQRAVLL